MMGAGGRMRLVSVALALALVLLPALAVGADAVQDDEEPADA